MRIKREFEPCPEYQGVGVCVDVTPLKTVRSDFGERNVFRIVFEIDCARADGKRWCVWSAPFSPSLHEKSNFRKFVLSWLGRKLTREEERDFDTESLVGMAAQLTITHQESNNGEVYSNIALCRPHKGDPFEASADYVRVQDRDDAAGRDGGSRLAPKDADARFKRTTGTPAPAPKGVQPPDKVTQPGLIAVHIGKHKALQLRDLARESIEDLIAKWLDRDFAKIAKPTADDRRLAAALEMYRTRFAGAGQETLEGEGEPEAEPDEIPMEY